MQPAPLFVRPKYLFELPWTTKQLTELLYAYDSFGYGAEESREQVMRLLDQVQGLEN